MYLEFFDDQRLAASFSDSRAFLWTVAPTPTPLRPRALPAIADIRTAAIDAQNRWLATVSGQRTPDGAVEQVEVWNLAEASATAKPVRMLRPGRELVTRIAFSPDCEQLLTVSGNTVELWNANKAAGDDKPLASLVHSDRVLSIAFDADGRRLVTASADQTARIWDARTGRPLAPPLGNDGPVTAVAFDGAGKRDVTATAGTARIWDARIWDARTGRRQCHRYHRWLTTRHRQQAGGNDDHHGCGRPHHLHRPYSRGWSAPCLDLGYRPEDMKDDDKTWLISARHRLQVRPDNGIEVTSRSDRGGPLTLLPQLRYPLTGIVVSPDGG